MNQALDPTRSVSVAASAGSGKTWQLVSRIVRLLLAGAEPGGILALTFTRKAAAEMRERVEARLRELAYADDAALDAALRLLDLDPDAALRANARGLHERLLFAPFGLRAQTLHAFCQDLLTRFAVEAEAPAGFSLIESDRAVIDEAIEALLAELHRRPGSRDAQALATLIELDAAELTIRSWLRGFAERRADWWAWTEAWRDDGLDAVAEAAQQLAADLAVDPDDTTPPEAAFDAPGFSAGLKRVHELLRSFGGLGALKAETIAPALEAGDAASRGEAAAKLLTGEGQRRALKIKKGVAAAAFDEFMARYEQLCATLERVAALRAARTTWQRSVAAITLGARLLDHLQRRLAAQHALSFADLEWRSYRLLKDRAQGDWVRYKLDRRIAHLLLDEFQDTSPTQWALLLPLLEDMAADGERRRTAFVVGDAKQSIYGFRRANPELLAAASGWVSANLRGETVPLNASRRSAPAIIAFVNALFAGDAGATIGFEPHDTHRRKDWGAVEVAKLIAPDATSDEDAAEGLRYPLTTPRLSPEDCRLATESAQLAGRIRTLIEARLPVADDGAARALGYGDVMILARSRTHLWGIEQALAAHGIPFVGSTRGGLLDTVLARDLMALLRFLDVPARDLDLAQVLRSPLFGASDADLVALASAGESGRDWWSRLQALAAQELASAVLVRAARLLGRWLALARRLPAHDLLDRIDAEAGAAARYEAALPQDRRVRANLGAFLQQVLDIDQGRYPTLGRLNAELARLAVAAQDAPDEAPPPATNAVRVMTIHAAKGLEAPAVFIVNAAPTVQRRDAGWLVDWPSGDTRPRRMLLVGAKAERDPVSTALVAAQRLREDREELNLLYVAATRARQYLFVSAFAPKRGSADDSWHGRAWRALEALPQDREPLPAAATDARGYRDGPFPPPLPTPPVSAEGTAPSEDPRLRQRVPSPARTHPSSQDAGAARDPDAAARGIAIHWLIEQLAAGRALPTTTLATRLESVTGSAIDSAALPGWLAEARAVLAAPALAAFFDPARIARAWNEVPVQWLGDDGDAQGGVIDRLVDDGERLWVLDYKTAPRPQPALLAERYRPQLEAYVVAIAKLWPDRKIGAGLILTATAAWLQVLN